MNEWEAKWLKYKVLFSEKKKIIIIYIYYVSLCLKHDKCVAGVRKINLLQREHKSIILVYLQMYLFIK